MAKAKTEEKVKASSKVRLRVHSSGTSTIYRNDGLPSIDDKTDKAIQWLFDKGYKAEEVEIIGEKPACWEAVFAPPKAVTEETEVKQEVAEVKS